MLNQNELDEIGQFAIEELGKELIKQQHKATGDLIASLDFNIISQKLSDAIIVTMNDYGKFVNTGRKRGAAKVPIQALVDWIKQKGIESDSKKVLGIAFAIQKTIQKEGSPTVRSRARGKKVEFVEDVIERIQLKVFQMVEKATVNKVQISIDNLVKRT